MKCPNPLLPFVSVQSSLSGSALDTAVIEVDPSSKAPRLFIFSGTVLSVLSCSTRSSMVSLFFNVVLEWEDEEKDYLKALLSVRSCRIMSI